MGLQCIGEVPGAAAEINPQSPGDADPSAMAGQAPGHGPLKHGRRVVAPGRGSEA